MTSHLLEKAVAEYLLDRIATESAGALAGWDALSPEEREAHVTMNGLSQVIGAAMRRLPPGPERDAVKVALAPLMGVLLGKLLQGQPLQILTACIQGHSDLLAQQLGGTAQVTVEDAPAPRPSHLKVIQ